MLVETVFSMMSLSMMSLAWHTKTMRHRAWDGFEAHLAYTIAAFNILVHFNILVQWNGLQPDATGKVRLSIARFTL